MAHKGTNVDVHIQSDSTFAKKRSNNFAILRHRFVVKTSKQNSICIEKNNKNLVHNQRYIPINNIVSMKLYKNLQQEKMFGK